VSSNKVSFVPDGEVADSVDKLNKTNGCLIFESLSEERTSWSRYNQTSDIHIHFCYENDLLKVMTMFVIIILFH
jgi:hypothetical protein